jgi:2-polyprenyl-3-methyl-5-hydroxy-6-metoxy-1,4-benzoquinol methylase
MPKTDSSRSTEYSLATGSATVRRLGALHSVYSPAGRRVLLQAGLREGMKVADFGCGVGMVTRMLAEMVGDSGSVTGIDISAAQVKEARQISARAGVGNVSFLEANACDSGLQKASFDLAYCRFLLLHLPEPAACLHEMKAVLKPGGLLVAEDGDVTSAMSQPATALNACADLFGRLGPTRGLDYSMAKNLYPLVKAVGFLDVNLEIHQPEIMSGENRNLLKWSVEEAGPAFVGAGLISAEDLARTLVEMEEAADDPDVLILAPKMFSVWARKAEC